METTFDKKLRLQELKKQVDESSAIIKSTVKDLGDLNKKFNDAANETGMLLDDYNKNRYIKGKPYRILLIKVSISLILSLLLAILSVVAAFIRIDWYVLIPLGLSIMLLLYGKHLMTIILSGLEDVGIEGDLDYIYGDIEYSMSVMNELNKEYENCYANYQVQFKTYQELLKEYQDLYKEMEE